MSPAGPIIWHPIVLRELVVSAVTDLTPGMRRITLSGPALGPHESHGLARPGFLTLAADDHVKLFFAAAGTREPVLPVQQDGYLEWPESGPRPISRDYTVRRFDPVANELDIDVVRHQGGIASQWAGAVRTGDRMVVAGPKGSYTVPDDAQWYLLAGDETALPAIARWVEELPAGRHAVVVVEVAGPGEEQALVPPAGATAEIHWVHRSASPSSTLDSAIAALRLPSGIGYAWVSGEAGTVRQARTVLRGHGFDRNHARFTGYWRRAASGDDRDDGAAGALVRLTDLLTPFAIRAAASLRICDYIAAGATTPAALARATGVAELPLRALGSVLVGNEVLRAGDDESLSLAPIGELLLDDDPDRWRAKLDLEEISGHLEHAWSGLLAALRGEPGYATAFGRSIDQTIASELAIAASLEEEVAEWAGLWAPLLAAQPVWKGRSRVVQLLPTSGPAAVAQSCREALLAAHPEASLETIPALSEAALPAGADVYLLADVLPECPDTQALSLLRRCADAARSAADSRVLVMEAPEDAAEDPEETLRRLTVFGAPLRGVEHLVALLPDAGLELVSISSIGEGYELLEAVPVQPADTR